MTTPATTRDQILCHAQKLIRMRGCNGFSYRDLAEHVGVKTSSIHYYFPCKDDLLYEAICAYREHARAMRQSIDESLQADVKLERFIDIVGKLTEEGELCLCGAMAADVASVPDRVSHEVQMFVQDNEVWLTKVLAEGGEQGSLRKHDDVAAAGRALFATIQGSGLVCRLFKTTDRLYDAIDVLRVTPRRTHAAA